MKDIERMFNTRSIPFGNAYDAYVIRLADYYISKSDGLERIKQELKEWDKGSKNVIVNDVVQKLQESGVKGFMKDFLEI